MPWRVLLRAPGRSLYSGASHATVAKKIRDRFEVFVGKGPLFFLMSPSRSSALPAVYRGTQRDRGRAGASLASEASGLWGHGGREHPHTTRPPGTDAHTETKEDMMLTTISTRYTMIGIVAAMLVVASTAWAKGPRPNLITCTDADKTVTLSLSLIHI